MRLFDFLLVLVSIILGLGLSEILTGFGQLLRHRAEAHLPAIHCAFSVLVLLVLLQDWWGSWGLRGMGHLNFPDFLLFTSGPILLFLIAYLTFPQHVLDRELEAYYFEQAPVLWSLGALYVVTTIVFRPIAIGVPLMTPANALRGSAVSICVLLASTRRKPVHVIGVGVGMLLFLLYVGAFVLQQAN